MAVGIESARTVSTAAVEPAASARVSRFFFCRTTRRPTTPWTRPAACAPSYTRSSTCRGRHGAPCGGRARSQPRCCSSRQWQPVAASMPFRLYTSACAPCRPGPRLLALSVWPRWACRADFLRVAAAKGKTLLSSTHGPEGDGVSSRGVGNPFIVVKCQRTNRQV